MREREPLLKEMVENKPLRRIKIRSRNSNYTDKKKVRTYKLALFLLN